MISVEVRCAACGAVMPSIQAESGPNQTFGCCNKCNDEFFKFNPHKAVALAPAKLPVKEFTEIKHSDAGAVDYAPAAFMPMSSPSLDVTTGIVHEPETEAKKEQEAEEARKVEEAEKKETGQIQ